MENTDQVKEIKPFRQVPFANSDAVLSITGAEFEAIQSILNAFKPSLDAIQRIFDRNLNEGNISIRYVTADGTEISKEQATEYLQKASEFLKTKEEDKSQS